MAVAVKLTPFRRQRSFASLSNEICFIRRQFADNLAAGIGRLSYSHKCTLFYSAPPDYGGDD